MASSILSSDFVLPVWRSIHTIASCRGYTCVRSDLDQGMARWARGTESVLAFEGVVEGFQLAMFDVHERASNIV